MASARKCDRCGKLYEEYNILNDAEKINAIVPVNLDYKRKYYPHKEIDLCPECMAKLISWLNCDEEELGSERDRCTETRRVI